MRKVYLCFIASCILFLNHLNAQVSTYTFSSSSGTYTAISGGTFLSNIGVADDDNQYANVPIGFNFTYNGAVYTTLGVSANGYCKFGGATPGSYYNGTSIQNVTNAVHPFSEDLDGTSSTCEIEYLVTGSAGSQVFTLQWKDWGFYSTGGSEINFQLKLFEGTNVIQYVYSPGTPNTSQTCQVGLTGATTADFNSRTTTTNWAATTVSAVNTAQLTWSSTIYPAAGLTYTWTPPACAAPGGLNAAPVGTTTATIGWNSSASAVSYDWEIRTTGACGSGAPVQSGNTTSPSVNLTGLTANTTYTYCVRTNCSGPTTTIWNSSSFTTLCPAISTFPYTESFSSGLPSCWSAAEAVAGSSVHWATKTSDATNGVSGPQSGTYFLGLDVYNALTTYNPYYVTTVPIALPTSYQLSYYYYIGTNGYHGTTGATGTDPYPLTIQISTNGGGTWTDIFNHNNSNTTYGTSNATSNWQLKIIDLSAYGGQTVMFRLKAYSNYGVAYCNMAVDEFTIQSRPAVDISPTALIVPAGNSCSNSNPSTIQATIKNTGSAAINFTTNPASISVNVSGAGTGTLNANVSTGTLAIGATTTVNLTPTFVFSNGGTYNFALTTNTTGDGDATNNNLNTAFTVNPTPNPVIAPANPRVCAGTTVAISTGGATSPAVTNSGAISINVPDASPVGATSTLGVSNIPAGATINSISVTINLTHTWDGDMIFNLVAPNGNVLNLINQVGGSGDNFTNTVISSTGTTNISSGAAPFTGTYAPSATNGLVASAGYTSNVTTFSGLYSAPNGNWILSMRDAAGGDLGVLTNWSISIDFTPPSATWYPRLGLYTDAAATIPYSGTTLSTVYAKPSSSITYTAVVSAAGCTGNGTKTVLVDKAPSPLVVPASPTVCNGQVQQLTVTSNSTAANCGVASGALSIAVPDNNAAGITNSLALNCVPAGAVISDIAVTINLNHTWDGDMIFNLVAPNGNILNLINQVGGSGDNFTSTTIASNGGLSGVSSGASPFLGSFAPSAANGVGPTGYFSNVVNFTGLYSVPNGNWTLAMRDAGGGDLGTLTSWSITIYYLLPDNTIWTPANTLYTDAGATTQYTGTNLATVYAKPPQTQLYTVTATNPSGCSGARNVTVTVSQPAAITSQPLNLNLCPGQTATFNVAASGAGLTYQWSFNGNPLSNGGNVSGATSATLNLANVSLADQGNYSVQVTGTCPPPSVTSVNAVLGVGQSPIITSQPQSQTVCSGNTASFSVGTSSPGVTYQWYKNGVAMVSGGNIIGATSATLTILSVTATDAGTYTVVINNYCSAAATSAGGVLTFSASDRWLGAANSDWNNPNNWCNGVPTPTTDVVILAGAPFNPVLSANGDVRNLQIDAGASVTVTGSGWLNIWGSTLTQNGTFNTSVGTISFRNTANLNVPAMNVANLIMNGAGGITMNGNLRVDTALTLTNGNITLGNNNLTMKGGTLGSVSSHIVTSGTGNVTNNNVGVATVVFPVGPSAASYNPLQIANGQGLNYSVGVATGVPGTLAAGTKAINRTWTVSSSSAPASPVQLTFNYADADANAGYNPATNMEAGYFNGTAWVVTTPAGGVQAMGSAAARQVYTTTSNFGTMVVSNVGGLLNIVTGTPNLNTDIFNVKMLPNLVSNQSVLRVNSRRAMNVEWTITDIQGRLIMKFERPILAGQNDINLKLGHLASGSYQLVGYTDKGTTSVVQFVKY